MNIEELREYCLSLPEVTEKMPWKDDKVFTGGLCFYVFDKWFCFTDVDNFEFIDIKLPPEKNEELRAEYEGVRPGWHMNKKYWSSVYMDSDLDDEQIKGLIKLAYETVVASLSKKDQLRLKELTSN